MYAINDIYATVQGEGCQTGLPMVLVRLQGCQVGCGWCDTKESWECNTDDRTTLLEAQDDKKKWATVHAGEILTAVNAIKFGHQGIEWILLTGGEPAEQDLTELVGILRHDGWKVSLETSGTALGHVGVDIDWITVSPKIGMPGGKVIRVEALASANEIKYVVGKDRDLKTLENIMSEIPDGATICLQPVSQSKKATELCVEACLEKGWRLSLQTHKYIGLK